REAAATECGDAGALGLDPPPCLRVIRRGDELLVIRPHLERKRPLTCLGDHFRRVEAVPDLVTEAQAIEPTGREDDRVEPAFAPLAETRVDVPPQRLDRERRLERKELRATPDRRRPDPQAGPQPVRAAKGIAGILSLQI